MLNKLQSHVESEETRWESQLRQKENEVKSLRIELNEVMNKLNTNGKVYLEYYSSKNPKLISLKINDEVLYMYIFYSCKRR